MTVISNGKKRITTKKVITGACIKSIEKPCKSRDQEGEIKVSYKFNTGREWRY